MSLKSFFTKGTKSASSCTVKPEAITVPILKTLIPIRSLSEEKLQSFATERKSEVYSANSILFTQGEKNDSTYYLLQGTVIISDSAGKNYEVEANTPQAKFPLCSGIKHTLTVVAKTDVGILRVSQKIMANQPKYFKHPPPLHIPEILADSRLVQSFSQYYLEEEIDVPSLPNIAIKLSSAIQSNVGISEAAEIVQLDPVIAAKLIQVANCPLYLSAVPARTCMEAVNRIGLKATQNLVTMLSLKQIFQQNVPAVKKLLDQTWLQSIYISSICYVLASETKKVNPEEALLAGLVCDIGLVPFFNYAAKLPPNYYTEKEIAQAAPYIKGPVGSYILHEWDFPEELVSIPINSENWYQQSVDTLTLTDIVVLAKLHSKIGKPSSNTLPAITSIPAASKLDQVQLSPENSLHILHDAQTKIIEAKRIFST
ncbi:MAG: HDOD domain-containing protein [Gammaproteobacteria bacterium]